MNNSKINFNKIKNYFSSSTLKIIFVSFTTVIATILIIGIVLYQYRGKIYRYFSLNSNPVQIVGNNFVQQEKKTLNGTVISSTGVDSKALSQVGTVVDVVRKAKPAVVSVTLYQPADSIFGTTKKEVGDGSGFIISKDGLIVTNNHVVDMAGVDYMVTLNNGKEYSATVVGKDSVLDIALIKISATNLPYLLFADSDKLEVGQSVVTIGNTLGQFENSVSSGVISGLSRSITAGDSFGQTEKLDKVIQTDVAINPGNSGGPLLDLAGEVIGINVARVSGSSNIGFSIPINSVKNEIMSFEKTGKIVRSYVGIRYIVITADIQTKYNLSVNYGIWVKPGISPTDYAVLPGSPAYKAGIKEGDIILSINGQKLNAGHDFTVLIRGKNVGDVITMKVLSNGVEKDINVTLEQFPEGL